MRRNAGSEKNIIYWPLFFVGLYWFFNVVGANLCGVHLYASGISIHTLIYDPFCNPPSTIWYEMARLAGGLAAASFISGFFSSFHNNENTTSRGKPVRPCVETARAHTKV